MGAVARQSPLIIAVESVSDMAFGDRDLASWRSVVDDMFIRELF